VGWALTKEERFLMQVERGRRGDIIARIYDKAAPSARALRSALNAGSSAMRPSHSLLTAKVERYALQGRAGVGTTPPFFDAMSTARCRGGGGAWCALSETGWHGCLCRPLPASQRPLLRPSPRLCWSLRWESAD